jgi:electron transfer flavoprotein alpha subunit
VTQSVFAASTVSSVTKGIPVITVKPNSAVAPIAVAVETISMAFSEEATGTKITGRTPRESAVRPERSAARRTSR